MIGLLDKSINSRAILVHLASGIGNIVFATPLLIALNQMGFTIDLVLSADYKETATLFQNWSIIRKIYFTLPNQMNNYAHIIPAIPPFYWHKFARYYRGNRKAISRPPDISFYQNEQDYYLSFAHKLGYPSHEKPFYCLPIAPNEDKIICSQTIIFAPGCKTGEMAKKRWPFFPQLAEKFDDVVIVGTSDDLFHHKGDPLLFPSHVRSMVDKLSLKATAELLAGAVCVVANDSGLAHIAGAVGTPTIMIFGPTPNLTLGHFPPNVKILRAGLECEPCWLTNRFAACQSEIICLQQLKVDRVFAEICNFTGHFLSP